MKFSILAQDLINKVVCADSDVQETIHCRSDGFIDIHSVTIAILDSPDPCTVDNLIGRIAELNKPCKRSLKSDMRTDGKMVYERHVFTVRRSN